MSEEMILRHCSPTLAGLKTGNIITCEYESASVLYENMREWNRVLGRKHLRMLPLSYFGGKAIVYIYRPSALRRDLDTEGARDLLDELGYPRSSSERCISELSVRLRRHKSFPHEIGLFIGYPPEDVRGFIENRADGCKSVGCWKVYGDAAAAEKLFRKFRKCTDIYMRLHQMGRSVEQLAVAD